MNKLVFLFLFVFLFSVASAAPPVTTVQEFPSGYVIVESQQAYLKLNENHQYNFFVYNYSNGKLLDNSSMRCAFFLANSSGNVIYNINATYFIDGHWGVNINGGNFSMVGIYPYGLSCQDGSGGALSGDWEVTTTGTEPSGASTVIVFAFISMAFVFLFLSVFFKDEYWMLKAFFQFLGVASSLIAINSAKIIASDSNALGIMGNLGITIMIIVMSLFFLWIFVYAFKEIIKIFKERGALRWEY